MRGKEMSFFDYAAAVVCWLRIAVSPTLAGALIGVILYFAVGGQTGAVLFALFVGLGAVLGVGFAEWARRKHGTVNFISKSENFTPDLDEFVKNAERNRDGSQF
jgi:hypothetical protein